MRRTTYTISILLGALVVGTLYLITSSMMYEPLKSDDDDGGTGLRPHAHWADGAISPL